MHEEKDGEEHIRRNFDDFAYDIAHGELEADQEPKVAAVLDQRRGRESLHAWAEVFGCCPTEDEPWMGEAVEELCGPMIDPIVYVLPDALLPRGIAYDRGCRTGIDQRIIVAGIPVSIKIGPFAIEIVVEGEMDEAMATELAEDIRG